MRWFVAALVLACAGCGGAAGAESGSEPPLAGGQIPLDGCAAAARSADPGAIVRWPAHPQAPRPPLVVAFHPASTPPSLAERYYRLDALAERDGVAVVYPNAVANNHFWQLRAGQTQDVARTMKLLDALAPCVDAHRVDAFGVSNGGGFTARVGCELAARFDKVAAIAGGYKAIPACRSTTPVGLLEIHGLADTVVPYGGSGPRHKGAVVPFVARWAHRNHCGDHPRTATLRRGVRRRLYSGCAKPVEALALAGTSHGLPGGATATIRFPVQDPTGLKGRTVAWRFFDLS